MNFLIQTFLIGFVKDLFVNKAEQMAVTIAVERLLSRVLAAALRKLATFTTNTLDDEVVEAVIATLSKEKLPEIK